MALRLYYWLKLSPCGYTGNCKDPAGQPKPGGIINYEVNNKSSTELCLPDIS